LLKSARNILGYEHFFLKNEDTKSNLFVEAFGEVKA
jgi:hypothetical protein